MPQIKEKAAFSNHLDEYQKAKLTTTYQLTPRGREEEREPSSPSTPSTLSKLLKGNSSPDASRSQSPVSRKPSTATMKSEEVSKTEEASKKRTKIVDLTPKHIVTLFQQFQIPISETELVKKSIDGKLLDLLEGHQDILDLILSG